MQADGYTVRGARYSIGNSSVLAASFHTRTPGRPAAVPEIRFGPFALPWQILLASRLENCTARTAPEPGRADIPATNEAPAGIFGRLPSGTETAGTRLFRLLLFPFTTTGSIRSRTSSSFRGRLINPARSAAQNKASRMQNSISETPGAAVSEIMKNMAAQNSIKKTSLVLLYWPTV
jgi:hypothetical protein